MQSLPGSVWAFDIHHINLDFRSIEPACMLWCVMEFNFTQDPFCLFLAERLIECLFLVRVEIIGDNERRDPEFKIKSAAILHTYKQVEVLREKANNGEDVLTAYISYDEKPGIQAIGNVALDLPPSCQFN